MDPAAAGAAVPFKHERLVEACKEWGEEGAPARSVELKCDGGCVVSHAEG